MLRSKLEKIYAKFMEFVEKDSIKDVGGQKKLEENRNFFNDIDPRVTLSKILKLPDLFRALRHENENRSNFKAKFKSAPTTDKLSSLFEQVSSNLWSNPSSIFYQKNLPPSQTPNVERPKPKNSSGRGGPTGN
jgi:hypothetical protein